ncbi:MAG: AEC family transporter [Rectinemataceae bacterium]|nr:AEC family transporter [Rectinemataceae bacterium]
MIVLSRVFSIFILMIIGYAARKARVLDPSLTRGLSGFILNVAIPFTIIAGFDRNIPSSVLPDLGRVALWAVGLHGFFIAFSTFAYRKFPESDRKVLSYITVFSNCGFMGFPIAESVFGKIGVMYASIYVIIFQIFIWTYGVSLFAGSTSKNQVRAAIFNTGNASVLIGIAIWLLPFEMPEAIDSTIVTMASLTTPLSMIVVGATLADVPIAGLIKGRSLWIGTAMRIILIPLFVYSLMRLLGIDGFPARIAAFLTAMPAAAQSVIFAERYNSNVGLASKLVFVTTILSALTIPVFAVLLN